ncbi:DHA2 family efflux MFS transporter permease subunit [Roseiarcus sp.]|uniref:DHA2 family efflux MFS transporter permease subunit n=1 Tax=Roseiarcus sp. TaxID=1969460 RepID=UPI003F974A06
MTDAFNDDSPTRRTLLTIGVMLAVVMQALDTTIANVALPYMQGSLSTTQDQINWVLTSYIVASAIMTGPIGWAANRFGRKRLFVMSAAGFTLASMLCGIAQTIGQMVGFRLLQGVFGAGLVPLAQAVMLDIYPVEKRGSAMATFGMGVMLGPIMGPTLGGWLTDSYSWRWVFYVNLPFGVLTAVGLAFLMRETPTFRTPFSWIGFLSLSLGVGALQLMLDRGQDLGWFDSGEIVVEAILSVVGFYFFFAEAATTGRPFIPLRMFRDRNFALANGMMFLNGLILLATMALLTPFLQTLLGYPVVTSGFMLGARGIGTLGSMMLVGRLLNNGVDPRGLMLVGWSIATYALWQMSGWNAETPGSLIVVTSVTQGAGLGLVFVPLQTVGYSTLPAEFRTYGAAMWTLVRNIGSSIGISLMIANLVNNTAIFHSHLTEFVTPFNDAMKLPNAAGSFSSSGAQGLAMLDGLVTQQAATIAYCNDFLIMAYFSLIAFPLILMFHVPRAAPASGAASQTLDENHATIE